MWGLLDSSFPCFIYLHSNVNKINTNPEVRTLYDREINIILRLISIGSRIFPDFIYSANFEFGSIYVIKTLLHGQNLL